MMMMKKAMRAMKAKAGPTATSAFTAAVESAELKPKHVKTGITISVESAASELRKNGDFKFGSVLNRKLKKEPAKPVCKGINPFKKEPRIPRPTESA